MSTTRPSLAQAGLGCLAVIVAAAGCRMTTTPFTPLGLAHDPEPAGATTQLLSARSIGETTDVRCRESACVEMLLVFASQVAAETVDPGDFLLLFEDGRRELGAAASLAPASERDENHSVVVTFSRAASPVAVQVIDALYDESGTPLRGSRVSVERNHQPPTLLFAVRLDNNGICESSGGFVVRTYWSDSMQGASAHDVDRIRVHVDTNESLSPRSLSDTEVEQPDNVIDFCVDDSRIPRSIDVFADTFLTTTGLANGPISGVAVHPRPPGER